MCFNENYENPLPKRVSENSSQVYELSNGCKRNKQICVVNAEMLPYITGKCQVTAGNAST